MKSLSNGASLTSPKIGDAEEKLPQHSKPGTLLGTSASGLWRMIRVRMRFFMVLFITATVVGQWEIITTYAQRWLSFVSGETPQALTVSPDTEFFCPMCPGALSNWPDRCPVCFMPLVRRQKGEAMLLPEGVTARMQLSPQRIQLAGIRTEALEFRELHQSLSAIGEVKAVPTQTGSKPVVEELFIQLTVAPSDRRLLDIGQMAQVSLVDSPETTPWLAIVASLRTTHHESFAAQFRIVGDERGPLVGSLVRLTYQRQAVAMEPYRSLATSGKLLAVPQMAVVDTGDSKLVFVESAPGMFDAVPVVLGARIGEFFPVLDGLQPGQKVASAGAFLIDAETRLNANVRSTYFGSGSLASKTSEPDIATSKASRPVKKKPTVRELLAKFEMVSEDRAAAEKQQVCPVTKLTLGSMGEPVSVMANGKRVFICCEGCRAALEESRSRSPP